MTTLGSGQIDNEAEKPSPEPDGMDMDEVSEEHTAATLPDEETPLASSSQLLSDSLSRLRQVGVQDVGVALPETFARLVLSDLDRKSNSFTIPISLDQGSQVAAALRGVNPPRPLSHQLFASVLLAFDLRVEYVAIRGIQAGNYVAEIAVSSTQGNVKTFGSRASDAILMALSSDLPVPILADISLFDESL